MAGPFRSPLDLFSFGGLTPSLYPLRYWAHQHTYQLPKRTHPMTYVAHHEDGKPEALRGVYGPFAGVEEAMRFGQSMWGVSGPWFWEVMVKPETALANRALNGSK